MAGLRTSLTFAALALLAPAAASRAQTRSAVVGPEMLTVPGGVFQMGIDDGELALAEEACRREFGPEIGDYKCVADPGQANPRFQDARTGPTRRKVHVSTFAIDRLEVTSGAYRACVTARVCDPRPLTAGDTRYVRDDWPVVNVSWQDARDYCAWRGKRLPTEAEWEKAARGTDGRRWPWGGKDHLKAANLGRVEPEEVRNPRARRFPDFVDYTVDPSDGAKIMAPPGSFPLGRSPYGVMDMAGNVSEWVADWYTDRGYGELRTVDPQGPDRGAQSFRVVRGGSFEEPRLFGRAYYRNAMPPASRSISRGFRCARGM